MDIDGAGSVVELGNLLTVSREHLKERNHVTTK
jgi:hypothetical protein